MSFTPDPGRSSPNQGPEFLQFNLQVNQALAGRSKSKDPSSGAQKTPTRQRHALKAVGASRRHSSRLPFMKQAQRKKPALTSVDEGIRNDRMELESMMEGAEEDEVNVSRFRRKFDSNESDSSIFSDSGSSVFSGMTPNRQNSVGGSSWGQASWSSLPQLGSTATSTTTSAAPTRPTSASSRATAHLAKQNDVDKPMPFEPFCKKCSPIRPTDCLCLEPQAAAALKKMEKNKQSFSVFKSVNVQDVSQRSLRRGSTGFAGSRAKGSGNDPNRWNNVLNALKVSEESTLSAFEGCGATEDERDQALCTDPKRPLVMHKLTPWEISMLECWAMQHVKSQYLHRCVVVHAEAPLKKAGHRDNMHSATICQLVRKSAKNKLEDVEKAFMIAKLRFYPLLRDLPEGMLEGCVDMLDVRTYAKGATVFNRGDKIDGIHILVQGDVELADGDVDALGSSANVKTAPSVILLEDGIHVQPSRPFLLKPVEQRVRSRTVMAWDDDDANTTAMLLWLPFSVIGKAGNFWRKREAHDRIDLIVKQFAPAMRLDKATCEKYCAIFELESFPKNHAILQQGGQPPMEQARLGMIVEGEVRIVRYEKARGNVRKSGKESVKDKIGAGKVLGESALYGQPYPHYAVVLSDMCKILSVKVSDFFEKLLGREATPLDKALICQGTLFHRIEDTRLTDETHDAKAPDKDLHCAKREMATNALKQARIALDNAAVTAREWKTVPAKDMLKWRQPPDCTPHRTDRIDASKAAAEMQVLSYPRDCDLFPSAQRGISTAQRTCSPFGSASLVATTVPSSRAISSFTHMESATDSMFASLDDQIRKKLVDAEELEAEHFLHTALGVYMEDADRPHTSALSRAQLRSAAGRSYAPSSRPNTTPGGKQNNGRTARNVVLMTCGSQITPRGFSLRS